MRMADRRPLDEVGLCYLLDALYPPAWTASSTPAPMTTVDLRIDILTDPTPKPRPRAGPSSSSGCWTWAWAGRWTRRPPGARTEPRWPSRDSGASCSRNARPDPATVRPCSPFGCRLHISREIPPMIDSRPLRAATLPLLLGAALMLQGCVVGAVVGGTAAVVGGTAKATGAVVGARLRRRHHLRRGNPRPPRTRTARVRARPTSLRTTPAPGQDLLID